jgi:hypothetical protein
VQLVKFQIHLSTVCAKWIGSRFKPWGRLLFGRVPVWFTAGNAGIRTEPCAEDPRNHSLLLHLISFCDPDIDLSRITPKICWLRLRSFFNLLILLR